MKLNQVRLLKSLATMLVPSRYRPALAWQYFGLTSRLYAGDQVTCPCCNGHFRQFLPSASSRRPNVVCPRCLSLERHRLLWLYLQERTNLFIEPLKLLHIAPELCFYHAFRKLPKLNYLPADLDSPLAAVSVDITDIPYNDGTFDVIICNHVLEHIDEDRKAISELYRVLKPGGWAILQSPLDTKRSQTFEDLAVVSPQDRKAYYGHDDHRRIYGLDYKDRLESAGFTVKIDGYVRELGEDVIQKYRLTRNEDIYFCAK